jgi:hypothetical protein
MIMKNKVIKFGLALAAGSMAMAHPSLAQVKCRDKAQKEVVCKPDSPEVKIAEDAGFHINTSAAGLVFKPGSEKAVGGGQAGAGFRHSNPWRRYDDSIVGVVEFSGEATAGHARGGHDLVEAKLEIARHNIGNVGGYAKAEYKSDPVLSKAGGGAGINFMTPDAGSRARIGGGIYQVGDVSTGNKGNSFEVQAGAQQQLGKFVTVLADVEVGALKGFMQPDTDGTFRDDKIITKSDPQTDPWGNIYYNPITTIEHVQLTPSLKTKVGQMQSLTVGADFRLGSRAIANVRGNWSKASTSQTQSFKGAEDIVTSTERSKLGGKIGMTLTVF